MVKKFPYRPYASADLYLLDYVANLTAAHGSVDGGQVQQAAQVMKTAIENDHFIFACGNGGSAAISNHLTCDCSKGIATTTNLKPRIVSLSSTAELLTAIANDVEFAEVFVHQLRNAARPGDVLITISSSGDSENVVRALSWARENGVKSIAMTGFMGGRSAKLADLNLHVAAENYGIVEDVHQSLMHVLAQYVRQTEMPADAVHALRF